MALDVAEQQHVQQRVAEAVEPGSGPGLPAVRQSAAPGKTGFDKALAQPAALAEPEQEALLQLFVDAGNADEEGRRDLADVDRDGVDQLRKADGAAEHQMHHLAIAALGDMAQRQITHGLERLVGDPDGLGVDVGGIDQVAVRQHRALRRAGRARRIDQDRDVVGRGLRNQAVEGRVGVGVLEGIRSCRAGKAFRTTSAAIAGTAAGLSCRRRRWPRARAGRHCSASASSTLSVCSWSPVTTTRAPEWRTIYCSSTQGLVG